MYKGFKKVQLKDPQRSTFDLSHEKRLSTRMGKLTPIFISETLPNDTFRCNSEVMLRLAPMIAPIMHRVNVYVHYFFVPMRILNNWWEEFITGGRTGEEPAPVPTYLKIQEILNIGENLMDVSSLSDYLGIPPTTDATALAWNGRIIHAAPFLAYQKIYWDYYRDRNFVADDVIDFPNISEGDAFNAEPALIHEIVKMRYRCWEQDYFTTAATSTQRGFEVLMPLQGSGSVTYLDESLVRESDGSVPAGSSALGQDAGVLDINHGGTDTPGRIENIDEVQMTTSDVSINDFRMAIALQAWQERQQVAGSRFNETIMSQFHRRTSDARLQRAEYLGGGKVTVKISEVVTTAFSEDGDANNVPAGSMAGHGLSFGNTNKFSYNCEEWGFVIGIMSVMPSSAYDQGIPRMFSSRNTFLQYPWPVFGNLGEQEVYKHELFFDTVNYVASSGQFPIFGYQSRYCDWKNISSSNHGDMRTGQSLEHWSLTRKFESSPVLGETFVTFEDKLQNRIFNVEDVDVLWCYIYNQCTVKRSLPYYGTPATLA